jgi:hypothetical protein
LRIYYIFKRILEAFIPILIILITNLFQIIEKFTVKIQKFNKLIKKKIDKFFRTKILKFLSIFLLISPIYLYALKNTPAHYIYDDSITQCIFYLKIENIENSRIAVHNYKNSHSPYDLLIEHEVFYYSTDFNLNFSDFWAFLEVQNIDYLIINLSIYNQIFINSFQSNCSFIKLVGNSNIRTFSLFNIIK